MFVQNLKSVALPVSGIIGVTPKQWRTQDFRMGGVEVSQAPMTVESGEGVSSSTLGEGSGDGAVPPPHKIFRIFC